MIPHVLFVVVGLQVLAFQFLSVRLIQALPDYLVGRTGLPPETSARIAEFKRRARMIRYGTGTLLLLAASVIDLALPIDVHARKLGLALVSLLSSAAFAGGYLLDRRAMRRMAGHLPEPRQRVASLERRTLRPHYPPVLEGVPAALLVAAVWLGFRTQASGKGATIHPWTLPIVLALFLALTFFLSLRNVRSGTCFSPRGRAFQGPPEQTLAVERSLLTLELRHLLACRIGLALWVVVNQSARLASLSNSRSEAVFAFAGWIVLACVLALVPIYGYAASRIARTFSEPSRQASAPVAGKGGIQP